MALTAKQEAFCLSVASGKSQSEAYRLHYNCLNMKAESVHRKATELMDNGKVTARIAELQAAAVKRHEITVDDLIAELEEARDLAKGLPTPQVSAAVAATMGKAKMLGFLVERHAGADGGNIPVSLTVSFVPSGK